MQSLNLVLKKERRLMQTLESTQSAQENMEKAVKAYDQTAANLSKKFRAALIENTGRAQLSQEMIKYLKNAPKAEYRLKRGSHLGANAITGIINVNQKQKEPALVPTEEGEALSTWQSITGFTDLKSPEALLMDMLCSSQASVLREIAALLEAEQGTPFLSILKRGTCHIPTPMGNMEVKLELGNWPNIKEERLIHPRYSQLSMPLSYLQGEDLGNRLRAAGHQIVSAEYIIKEEPGVHYSDVMTSDGKEDPELTVLIYHCVLQAAKMSGNDFYGYAVRYHSPKPGMKVQEVHSFIHISQEILQAWNCP